MKAAAAAQGTSLFSQFRTAVASSPPQPVLEIQMCPVVCFHGDFKSDEADNHDQPSCHPLLHPTSKGEFSTLLPQDVKWHLCLKRGVEEDMGDHWKPLS